MDRVDGAELAPVTELGSDERLLLGLLGLLFWLFSGDRADRPG